MNCLYITLLFNIVNILGTQHAHNFLYLIFSVTASWIVVLDNSGMMWCNCLIVTRRFARISPSISWRRSSEINDGLRSSWTSVLPSENSRHHFVTFFQFITLPQTAIICLWISTGLPYLHWENVWWNVPRIWLDFGSALPFRTRLTQTKPILPLSNEQGSQVKDQGRRQFCYNKHKNFTIGQHVM
jgi:hypothetical protein